MKNGIVSILAIAALIAVQFYLFIEQKFHASFLAAQQAEARYQDRARLAALEQGIEAVQESLGLIKSDYASAREAQFRELRDKLNDALSNQNHDSFQALRDKVDEIINTGALIQDHSLLAEEAFALAEEAMNTGDSSLASIYYLSSVNHAPSEFRFLKAYSESITRASDARPKDIARLRSVLQLSMYQVPPSNITDLISLLDKVDIREAELLSQQIPQPEPVSGELLIL